jgi:glutamate racemase
MSDQRPVGVFDSGLGGLSVLREMRALLPAEDVLYYADNAYCPYGVRSRDEIQERSERISRLLIEMGAKAIVVACNTASAMVVWHLRDVFPGVPFVGLEPAVKPAVALTRTGRVGVLATPRTVAGERLRWLIETYADGVEVRSVAATGLVELVEAGTLTGPSVTAALRPLLDPMLEAGVDVVVLGCTHYPFLRDEIEAYVGPDIPVIDSGLAIARRTLTVLREGGLLDGRAGEGALRMMTSADADEVGAVARLLMPDAPAMTTVPVEHLATAARAS